MPDYTFMRWDEATFLGDKYPLIKAACEAKRYALAADVCRFNVLAEYGGIYLDTDVELFQRLDKFLDCNFFSAIELYNEFESEHIREQYLNKDGTAKDSTRDVPHLEILTSIMGSVSNQSMVCEIRNWYNHLDVTVQQAWNFREWMNLDRMVARYLTKYGFRYSNETQCLQDNIIIYGTGLFGHAFCPDMRAEVGFHHNAASWKEEQKTRGARRKVLLDKLGLLNVYLWMKKVVHGEIGMND